MAQLIVPSPHNTSYRLFGLTVEASDPIPGLRPTVPGGPADIRIQFGSLPLRPSDEAEARPWYVSPFRDERQRPLVVGWTGDGGRFFHLVYPDGPEFLVNAAGTEIWGAWSPPRSPTSVAPYLLGPILAFALRLRGVVCLHASAVGVGGDAVTFVGPSDSGKSTIAAWFASKGHRVLADDLIALDRDGDGFLVRPAFPWLRLQRSAVAAIRNVLQPSPALVSVWDDEYLDLELDQPGYRFQREPLPVGAVYLIAKHDAPPALADAGPVDSLIELLAETWGSRVIDRDRRAEEFRLLGDFVAAGFVRRLWWSGRPGDLLALRDLVVADCVVRLPATVQVS